MEENTSNLLKDLEIKLHQKEVRSDKKQLDELLHDDFFEIGRSGKFYTKQDILASLSDEKLVSEIHSQDYSYKELAENSIMLTYKSAHKTTKGLLERHTYRTSIWRKTSIGWRMLFHQGTPTTF
jgi:hypothetical protein